MPVTGYVNSKNQGFRDKISFRDSIKGKYGELKNRVTNPLTYTRDLENARDAEGDVYINGRRLPGIFEGFRINGGVFVEKFDQKKYRNKLVDLPKGAQLFQIDKGLRPVTGSASFVLLDDSTSTAWEKSKEFIRQVTFWKDGESAQQNVKRVFRIKSFLIGADAPFNFSTIKIPDYNLDMGNQMAGRIGASFAFEQFEIFLDEFEPRRPETMPSGDDAGQQIDLLEVEENPLTQAIAV